jgi:septation ring formation regulator EzrA
MSIQSLQELENTRRKLRELEELYERLRTRPTDNAHLRDLTLSSLKKLMNQFFEEIVRYESHASLQAKGQ